MSDQNLTEWQTRKYHIDEEIIRRGWNLNDKNQVDEEYLIDWAKDKEGKPVNERYVDYLLFSNVNFSWLFLASSMIFRTLDSAFASAKLIRDHVWT